MLYLLFHTIAPACSPLVLCLLPLLAALSLLLPSNLWDNSAPHHKARLPTRPLLSPMNSLRFLLQLAILNLRPFQCPVPLPCLLTPSQTRRQPWESSFPGFLTPPLVLLHHPRFHSCQPCLKVLLPPATLSRSLVKHVAHPRTPRSPSESY